MDRRLKYGDVSSIIAAHFRFEKWPKTHFFCPKRKISIRFFSKSGQMAETFDQMPIFYSDLSGQFDVAEQGVALSTDETFGI